jgi:hypothetical protein
MPFGNPKDEYLEASNNQRHFQTARFAQLTVYLAIMGVLLNLLFGGSATTSATTRIVLQASGLIVTLLFWIRQERTMAYWYHFVTRAAELEKELGFKQFCTRPPAGILSSFKAMRLLFIILALFWASSFSWIAWVPVWNSAEAAAAFGPKNDCPKPAQVRRLAMRPPGHKSTWLACLQFQ